jgi:ABC-2 type transport system ATP-binding protein
MKNQGLRPTDSSLPIVVENLVKRYTLTPRRGRLYRRPSKDEPVKDALRGISFSLKPGEIFGLLGPNGAGKTSLISILTTLEAPSAGTAYIFGHDVRKESKLAKVQIGVVPQELVSHGFFTVREVLEFQSGYFGIKNNSQKINSLLERLSLAEHANKKILQLSGGMKRRFLIAKALVYSPRILLLDEPTAGVDMELRQTLWDFVKDLNREGVTVLLTTHYLEEAERLCDRVAVLDQGEIKALENTRDLISTRTFRRVVMTFAQTAPMVESAFQVKRTEHQLEFQIPSQMQLGALIQAVGVRAQDLTDIQIREGSLEDAMKSILGLKHG